MTTTDLVNRLRQYAADEDKNSKAGLEAANTFNEAADVIEMTLKVKGVDV